MGPVLSTFAAAPPPPTSLVSSWQAQRPVRFQDHVPTHDVVNHRVVLLFGRDGIGKSSLLDMLTGLEDHFNALDTPAKACAPFRHASLQHRTGIMYTFVEVPYLLATVGDATWPVQSLHHLLDALATYDGMLVSAVVAVSRRFTPEEKDLVRAVYDCICRDSSLPLLVTMVGPEREMPRDLAEHDSVLAAFERSLGRPLSNLCAFYTDDALVSVQRLLGWISDRSSRVGHRLPLECGRPHTVWRSVLRLMVALHDGSAERFVADRWSVAEQLIELGLSSAQAGELAEHPLLQPSYELPFQEKVVLVFGRTGSGKTSLLNALTGLDLEVSDSVVGVTRDFQTGQFLDDDDCTLVTLVDTAGLSEPSTGSVSTFRASMLLLDVLLRFNGQLNALCFVFGSHRFLADDSCALSLFFSSVCKRCVPAALISTNFQFASAPALWRAENVPLIRQLVREFADESLAYQVEPVQLRRPERDGVARDLFNDSVIRARLLIMSRMGAAQTVPPPKHGIGRRIAKYFFRLRHGRNARFPDSDMQTAFIQFGLSATEARLLAAHPLFQWQ